MIVMTDGDTPYSDEDFTKLQKSLSRNSVTAYGVGIGNGQFFFFATGKCSYGLSTKHYPYEIIAVVFFSPYANNSGVLHLDSMNQANSSKLIISVAKKFYSLNLRINMNIINRANVKI